MTQERFLKILHEPDLLAGISYEELKTLALAYPYAHNLRYLLALKSKQIAHPESARNLAAAAAYSLDRTWLFEVMAPKQIVPVAVLEPHEVLLELKPIELLRRQQEVRATATQAAEAPQPAPPETPAPVVPAAPEPAPAAGDEPATETSPAQQPEAVAADPEPTETVEAPQPAPPETPAPVVPAAPEPAPVAGFEPSTETAAAQQPEAVAADPEPPETAEADAPSEAPPAPAYPGFRQWISTFHAPVLVGPPVASPDQSEAAPSEAEEAQKISAQQLAEKSVTESKGLVSETLAKLYAKQGYRSKAIEMYERLCMAIPEKSAFFAAEIDKLKK